MAYNDISKNFTYENGGTIDGDLALTTMAANTKIKNKASGQLYAKRSGFTNVFDKTNTYANYLKADEFGINTSGSGNGVASITYSSSGRKITQNLTTFTTPSDLATANDNLKSQAVGSITVSGRTVTYKNVNGQQLGSFQTQDNNTTYSAGSGLSLNGTTFSLALTSSHIINALGYTPAREGSGGVSYGPERIVYTGNSSIGANQLVSGNILYGNAGNDSTDMSGQLGGTWKITSGLSYHHTYSYKYEKEGNSGQYTATATVVIYQCYAKQFLG
jgi:hypothetical protein